MPGMNMDIKFLQHTITRAKIAEQNGAVIVYQNEIIGEGYNQPISSNDLTAHAEIIALRNAAKNIGNYCLVDTILYVILESCVICESGILAEECGNLLREFFSQRR